MTTTTPQPRERAQARQARRVLRDLVHFALTHDPYALASMVDQVEKTRVSLDSLSRWIERYKSALPPRIQ